MLDSLIRSDGAFRARSVWTQFPLTANSMMMSASAIGRLRADDAQLSGQLRKRARGLPVFHPL